jgi:hypothetical protein
MRSTDVTSIDDGFDDFHSIITREVSAVRFELPIQFSAYLDQTMSTSPIGPNQLFSSAHLLTPIGPRGHSGRLSSTL